MGHTLRIALGAVAIFLLIHTGALKPRLLAKAIHTHPGWYLAALFLYGPFLEGVAYVRWYWLLREAKVKVSAAFVMKLHLMGLFFSGLLPGGTGGDLVKGFYLLRGRSKAEGAAAVGTLVVDRFAGMFGLLWLGAITNMLNHDLWEQSHTVNAQQSAVLRTQIFTFIGVSLAAAILVGIYFSPWKPRWLATGSAQGGKEPGFWKGLLASLVAFRNAPLVFWGVIALSMIVHLSLVGVYALCAESLEVDLPFKLHAFVAPTLTLLNGIPISPAGLGVGEAGGNFLYKAVGATHGYTEIPALVHTIVLLTALLCAPAYFLQRNAKKKEDG